MPKVSSSNLKSVDYDDASKSLVVSFMDGSIYQYKGVPMKKYSEILDASSAGEYFASNIRNRFPTIRVK